MAYCAVEEVKEVLGIEVEEEQYDTEISNCITSADGLVDSIAQSKGLTVPTPTPQPVKDASKHLAAHIFRARRPPAPDSNVLYELGMAFLNFWMGTYQVGKIL